jgi:hypothetical protein
MTPPPPVFSWTATVQGLLRPGRPPAGLPGLAFLLLVLCLGAVVALMWVGHARYGDSHSYFGERKVGTYLSFLNLVATGVVAGMVAHRLGGAPVARFWWVSAVGFVWLGCDDLFVLHERIDRGLHALLGWDPDHPLTDHLDDLIVAAYGLGALGLAFAYRAHLAVFRWMLTILAAAFVLFAAMVVVDFLHLSKTVEDALKVVAGTTILVGFLAAWLEVSIPGGPR